VAQVNVVLPLLDAQIPAEMRPRLLLAAADLATQAGWMSFDTTEHDAARRLWMIGLDLARNAKHPRSTDLTVYLLADMTLQSVHLGRPKEALYLARVGHTAAVGRYPVSASTTSLLRRIEAQAYAADGDAAGCDRALGQAVEQFGGIDPATAPPWTAYRRPPSGRRHLGTVVPRGARPAAHPEHRAGTTAHQPRRRRTPRPPDLQHRCLRSVSRGRIASGPSSAGFLVTSGSK